MDLSPKRATLGAEQLPGSMGVLGAESWSFRQMMGQSADFSQWVAHLTLKPMAIVAHYGTEPPQLNLVSVTTFFNPVSVGGELTGGVLGLDVLRPADGYPRHPLVPVVEYCGRDVPVFGLDPIPEITRAYLGRHPFWPGCRVFEANAEYSTLEIPDRDLVPGLRSYAYAAVGRPAGGGCRLLMEDAGLTQPDQDEKHVIESIAASILACEAVERERGLPDIEYEEVYVLASFSEPLHPVSDEHGALLTGRSFYPVWSQVQFLYAWPPEDMLRGRTLNDLADVSFEEWLEHGAN